MIERRIGLLFAVFVLALVAVTLRAAWLGVVRAGDLRARAVGQQVEEMDIPARRGTIADRHGVELAVSEDAITVFANPFLIDDPGPVARRLAPLVGVPERELLPKLADRDRGFVYLARKLDGARGERVRRLEIEGIGTVVEPRRRYPQGALAAQLVGFVGTESRGLAGVEHSRERHLHGSDGKRRVVKDALGKPVSLVDVERARAGRDLKLTIDTAIQERTEAVLAETGLEHSAKGATAVVMDPRTGELLALANWPRVNPNDLSGSAEHARQNRAIAASYEPGSTFKAFTVSGALEEGLVRPDTALGLPPAIQVADRTIEESTPRGGTTLTVSQILSQSSNVGAVTLGLKLGAERFDRWVRRFGFGEPTGIELPGEAAGIVPRPADYSGSSLGNLPMGQGLAVTQIQMAAAYSAIAAGGVLRRPHAIAGGGDRRGRRVLPAGTAREVRSMLEGVLGPDGTASQVAVEGYAIAGKTGTAEKPDEQGGYSKTRFVASFVGFAPARRPRVLIAVAVDEPEGAYYGAAVAAPAFEKIVSFCLPYLRIPPE